MKYTKYLFPLVKKLPIFEQVSQCKFIIKYRMWIWNFIEFIRFFSESFEFL
jgi:hypothetical protein